MENIMCHFRMAGYLTPLCPTFLVALLPIRKACYSQRAIQSSFSCLLHLPHSKVEGAVGQLLESCLLVSEPWVGSFKDALRAIMNWLGALYLPLLPLCLLGARTVSSF